MLTRRTVQGVLAATMLAAGLVGILDRPASADPAITLSTSAVTEGATVHVELAGFPGGASTRGVWICPVANVPAAGSSVNINQSCALLGRLGATATTADVVVHDANTAVDGDRRTGFRCTTLTDGCAIVGADLGPSSIGPVIGVASAPITFPTHPWTVTIEGEPITPWQPTTVTTEGFPAGPATIGVCGAGARSQTACVPLASFPSGMPAEAEVVVPYVFDPLTGGRQRCNKPCVLAAWVDLGYGTAPDAMDFATVSFVAPSVTVTPSVLANGETYTVTGSGLPPGPVSTTQCATAVSPGTTGFGTCVAGAPGTVAADGTVTIQGVASIPTAAGNCATSCYIGVLAGDATTGYAFATNVGVDAPRISSMASPPYYSGQNVWMEINGFGSGEPTLVQCKLPLGTDYASSQCGEPGSFIFGGGFGYGNLTVSSTLTTAAGTVSCRPPESCAIVLFRATDGRPALPPTPIEWAPRLVTDAGGAVNDGDILGLTATDLPPSAGVRVVRCGFTSVFVPDGCEDPLSAPLLTTDADGGLQTQGTVAQNLTTVGAQRYRHCRVGFCSFAVFTADGTKQLAKAPYWIDDPVVAVTPATGLTDGDTVTVTGTKMQPTYAGPTVLLPTGGWAIVQCDKAVGPTTSTSLVNVFQSCAVAPGGASVAVSDHASSTDVQVQGTITKILGGTTDCTTAPGACVIGFARWEQNGWTTIELTPLTFA